MHDITTLGPNPLDDLATHYRTDKGSKAAGNLSPKNYTQVYHHYFAEWRNLPLNFLEIGVAKGKSLRMWRDYFPRARIFGLDKNVFCKQIEEEPDTDRISIYIADQGKEEDLQAFLNQTKTQFHIIIDDGSHEGADQVISFDILFPALAPGGYYAIEDLHTAYRNQRLFKGRLIADLFTRLIEGVNHYADQFLYHDIAELHFTKSLLIIRKMSLQQSFELKRNLTKNQKERKL